MKRDSLVNYSYFIYGNTTVKSIEQGTGFLAKIKSKIYLVTAIHVLNGWEIFKNKYIQPYPDTLYIRVYKKSNNEPDFIPFNITQIKKLNISPNGYETPDIYFYPIDIPKKYKVYTLEKLIDKFSPPKLIDSIFIYGYPVNNEVNDPFEYLRLPVTLGIGLLKSDYKLPLTWEINGKTDYINYQVAINSGIRPGSSGSPAYFIKNSGSSKNDKIIFGGLVFSGDFEAGWAYIIRPEYIKSILSKMQNQ
ncbi:MAG: hypothetical protein M3N14_07095 [Bacteroidota bacterium]|nr:hypothetical protein [Bacteroidota bacterium]